MFICVLSLAACASAGIILGGDLQGHGGLDIGHVDSDGGYDDDDYTVDDNDKVMVFKLAPDGWMIGGDAGGSSGYGSGSGGGWTGAGSNSVDDGGAALGLLIRWELFSFMTFFFTNLLD